MRCGLGQNVEGGVDGPHAAHLAQELLCAARHLADVETTAVKSAPVEVYLASEKAVDVVAVAVFSRQERVQERCGTLLGEIAAGYAVFLIVYSGIVVMSSGCEVYDGVVESRPRVDCVKQPLELTVEPCLLYTSPSPRDS